MRRPRTIRAWAVLVWLALWQLGAMAIDQQIILVSPLRVLSRLCELIPTPDFWGSIAYSLVRITAGFLLGVAAGTVLAALSARFRRVEELLAPAMLAIKSIPVASFIILALILFSSRNLAVPISFLIVLPVLYSNVLGGIRAADSQLMEMARVFRIPVGRSIRYVYLPQVMPYFLSACGSAGPVLEVRDCRGGHRYAGGLYRRAAPAGQGLSGYPGPVCLDSGDCAGEPGL